MATASGISVRPARLADAERIGEIHVAAWREAYADLMPPDRLAALNVAERAAMWRHQLASGTARGIAVAEADGAIVGFASCTMQRSPALAAAGYAGEVAALYVLRAGQRRGAGRLLMQAMARRLIAEGYRSMALWVLTDNKPARAFYERLGGVAVAERVDGGDAEVAYGWRDVASLIKASNENGAE
ncbi:GNAT family N-acetyltransferase [Sphingomonas panacisoli]|uniref:GNAT family N-acetyltransferase n=1 Tax=Sphingomonas panacisoli TaxID=1813879 RepID=A0A5B8LHG9_9SPHN|nr:GNAT family N-acetyltransferase [Sphingomonas panacisoli]QDZ06610.1 GNAT family N-acetyltransferase [Sphingomonas panacisoli]